MSLGKDMSSLSTFHKMAYDSLASSNKPYNTGSTLASSNEKQSNTYRDQEVNNKLPYSSYKSKNSVGNRKEMLNDVRMKSQSVQSRVQPACGTMTSSNQTYQLPPGDQASNNICKDGSSDIEDSEINLPESSVGLHPLLHLSLNGIDQLEVISPCEEDKNKFPDEDLTIGSLVEVMLKELEKPLYGVIHWIGKVPSGNREGRWVAGIEMEDAEDGLSDGTLKGKQYFSCAVGKAIFVPLSMCTKDSRFFEHPSLNSNSVTGCGTTDCQRITGSVPPLTSSDNVKAMFGRNKGIQGHQNSCYLDATLFSMFAFTSVFDSLLFRPQAANDIIEYCEVQSVLREEIVNPLRKNMFVNADQIMKLRTMLDHLSSVQGLTTEEKDPEEFLHSLLAQILQVDPFLQLSSGQEAYHYQLFVDKDDKLNLPSVQTLFDQSFLTSDIKLKQIPSCLIIQMPRFGKDYKMYPRILPSMVLDVTDVIEDSPRQCIICGKLAEYECRECYGQCGSGLESIAFCTKCMDKVHSHKRRGCHASTKKLQVPAEFEMLADHCGSIRRVYMELFAVVCIETSHYVTFTRCGSGPDATWCFFDSMADRKGEQHGYNIPTVVECGDLMQWVGEESGQLLHSVADNKALPDLPRRLLCDAYMCFYQSPQVMMYA